MRILFVTFGEISWSGPGVRSAATLAALADAGHRIDVIAARVRGALPPHVRVLAGPAAARLSKRRLRVALANAARGARYDAAHAVDHAATSLRATPRLRKLPCVYDATRCFTGEFASPPSSLWRLFPGLQRRRERALLGRARVVLSPCPILAADLRRIEPRAHVALLNPAPLPRGHGAAGFDRAALERRLGARAAAVVACHVPLTRPDALRPPLMAARKVLEAEPDTAFVFLGAPRVKAERLATRLEILPRCLFLGDDDAGVFADTLAFADAVLATPPRAARYAAPELITLLAAPAPLIVARDGPACEPLNPDNHLAVPNDVDSMAGALRRAIQEPLFCADLAARGQRLVSESYSLSSFKHKLRMIYREALNRD